MYRNDGAGVFTDVDAGLTGVAWGSVAWGDYDRDGDLDILLAGGERYDYQGQAIRFVTKLYRNDNGVFTHVGANLPGIFEGKAAWGDYDNDGDLDVLLAGYDGDMGLSKVLRNDGAVGWKPVR